MNALNVLTGLYARLHNYPGVPYWLLTPFRKIVRLTANNLLPTYLSRLHNKRKLSGKDIIISFTSFPARIKDVWKVVESLKSQTIRPEKIILWLSEQQFPRLEDIPQMLRECEDALFEIRMVDGDIRSHKKYYYAMQEYHDKSIVTVDDDIYYHKDMLKTLLQASLSFPGCIIANISKRLVFDENGDIAPYSRWDKTFIPYSSNDRVQIGAGGVFYPPHCLNDLVFDKDLFLKLAPLADDLWLNMISRINHTPIVQSGRDILPLSIKNDAPSLKTINTGTDNMNDKQLHMMREWLVSEGRDDVYKSDYHVGNP